jgi:hypothetical protein
MKKTLLTLTLVTLGACAALAQGTVNFNNTATTYGDGIDRLVRGTDGAPLTGQNYVAALYFGATADAVNQLAVSAATPTLEGSIGRFRVSTTASPGTWSGGSRTFPAPTGARGATIFCQIRVWDQTLFPTYELAKNGGITGASEVFSYAISASENPGASELVMRNLRGFQLVPEPSTIALAVLGLGSLLLFRRRK